MPRLTLRSLLPLLALAFTLAPVCVQAQAPEPVVPAPGTAVYGDVNGDGQVSALDALAVLTYVVGRPTPAGYRMLPAADANGDGHVTAMDALVIAASAMGRDMSRFPVGQDVDGTILQPNTPSHDVIPVGSTLTLVGGNGQTGFAGDSLKTALQVVLKTSGGTPLGGMTVTWTVLGGGGSLRAVTSKTGATGIATNRLLLGPAGPQSVRASVSGAGEVNFTATSVDPTTSTIVIQSGDGQTGTVGDTLPRVLTVLVKDGSNVPVPNAAINWTVLSGGGSVPQPRPLTSASGLVSARWVLGSAPGAQTIRAQIPGGAFVTFTATAHGAGTSVITKLTDNLFGIVADSLGMGGWVEVKDSAGNPVSTTIDWVPQEGGAVSAARSATNSVGRANSRWLLGPGMGAQHLQASMEGGPTVTFTTTAVSADSVALAAGDNGGVSTDNQEADGGTELLLLLDVSDGHAHPISGFVAYQALTGGSPTVPGRVITGTGITGPTDRLEGRAPIRWVLGTPRGYQTLQASVAGGARTFTFTALSKLLPTDTLTQVGGSASGTVGQPVATPPSVRVADNNGNLISNYPVIFNVSAGGGSISNGVVTGTTVMVKTNGSGIATLTSWTLGTTAGTNTLHVTAGAKSIDINATGVAGAASSMTVHSANPQTGTAGLAAGSPPGVLVSDGSGNPVQGASVKFKVTLGGGKLSDGGPAADSVFITTNASGYATVTSWTLGTTAGTNNNTVQATFGALTPVTFTASADAGAAVNVGKTGDGQSAAVGTSVATNPSITVTDTYGNPVSGVSVTFTPSGNGTIGTGSTTTSASGVASAGVWTLATTAGANTLSVTAGALNASFSATGNPGLPATITKTAGDLQSDTVGGSVDTAPSVHVVDQYGNAVPGVTVTFAVVTAGGGSGGGVAGGSLSTNGSGNATVGSWTLGSGPAINQLTASANPAGTSSPVTFTAYVPPTAGADASQAMGNTTLASNVAPNVLTNDATINGGAVSLVPASIGALTTVRGGTVTLAADGGFSYLPAAGVTGRDSVLYTVKDTHYAGPVASASSNYIKLAFVGKVWYVESGFGGTATGRDVSPYTSVSAAEVVAGANDTILVRTGSGPTTGGTLKAGQLLYAQGASSAFTTSLNGNTVTLLSAGSAPSVGALTLGSGNTLRGFTSSGGITGSSFGTLTTSEVTINSGAAQALSLNTGTLSGGFTSVQSAGGTNNVSLTSVATSGTVTLGQAGDALTGASGDGVAISGGGGSFTFPGNVSNATSFAANVASKTGGTVTFSGNLNPSAAGRGVSVSGNSTGTNTILFSGATKNISSGSAAGVSLTSNTGATISFTNGGLAIASSTGTPFTATGGGTIEVTGSGNTISATGAAANAVNLNGVTLGSNGVAFSTITSSGTTTGSAFSATSVGNTGGSSFTAGSLTVAGTTGGTSRGLALTSNSAPFTFTTASVNGTGAEGIYLSSNTGAVAVNGGTVGNTSSTAGDALAVSGGTGAVTVASSLTKSSAGRIANIGSHSTANVTVSGTLSCTASCTGILASGNTSGTIDFSAATKTLSTGASAAVTLSSNTGATINFSNGGLAVTTTSGAGFNATGGGTVSVTTGANNNTISASGGTALSVSSTTIGASGLTFRSIAASGGSNGILLSSTGTSGGLTVTGDGATNGSGGTITNTSGGDGASAGNGVYLSSTKNVSLSWMALSGHANNGIFGSAVTGLTVNHVRITGNNGSSNSGDVNLGEESAVHLVNSSGALKLSNSRFDGGAWNGFLLRNTTGSPAVDSLVLSFDTVSTIQGSLADGRNDALQAIINSGTADVRMRNNNLTYWWGNAIQVVVGTGASGTARITNNVASQTSGALAGAGGIWVNGGNLAYNISNNNVQGTNGTAISADKGAFNTFMNGTIDSNTIGTSGVTNSGSGTGIAIFASHIGSNVTTVRISNNIIRQIAGSANGAITTLTGDDVSGGGAGTMNATIVGNNIQESGSPTNSAQHGILVTHGRVTADSDQGCYDIGGAGSLKNSITNFNTATAGGDNRIRVNERFVTTARFSGYTGSNTDNSDATGLGAYLLARNTATRTANANNVSAGGSGFLNTSPAGSACAQPTM
jgi:hypothetical protein